MTLAYSVPAPPVWKPAAVSAVAVIAAAGVGQIVTLPNLPWYETLAKPAFTPPDPVFGFAWTALYAAMAYAFYRVLRRRASADRHAATLSFATLLALNALWCVAFFGAHAPALGMLDMIVQALALIATALAFARLDATAAGLMIPVGLWLAYVGALNFGIMQLN